MISRNELQLRVQKAVTRGGELGTLAPIVQRVQQLTSSPQTSVKDLVRVISADAILTAKVLRVVNSAAYGFSERISNIDQAIVILGFRQLKDLCIGISMIQHSGKVAHCKGFDRVAMWRHSLATAVGSKYIDELLSGARASDLFVAGLLANIGRLVLDQHFPEIFGQILQTAREKNIRLIDAERQVMGATHADVGYWATTAWCFEESLSRAIRDHHGPSGNRNGEIVNLAYVIAQARSIGQPGDPMIAMLIPGILESLQIDEYRLFLCLRDLDEHFRKLEPLFNILVEASKHR